LQAAAALANVAGALGDAGVTDKKNVAKVTVFITDLANLDAFNTVFAAWAGDAKPVRVHLIDRI